MKKCKYCGKKTKDDDIYCSSCGANEFNYICANCGTEIEKGNFCPRCGLRVGTEGKFCRRCGTKYYTNACPNCGYTENQSTQGNEYSPSYNYSPSQAAPVKKNHTLLWILGWLLFFPLPATILIARSKKMNTVFKVILVVLVWLIYIGIINGGGDKKESSSEVSPSVSTTQSVTGTKKCEHKYEISKEVSGTCKQEGYIIKKCSKCGNEITESTQKQLGHIFVISDKILGTNGKITWECKTCKEKVSVSLDNLAKSENTDINQNANTTSEVITINARELGKYGRIVTLHGEYSDGEKFTEDRNCYKLPAGKYRAQTTYEKLFAFWIVKDKTTYEDDGVNEIFQYVGSQYSLTAGKDDYNGMAKAEVQFTLEEDESIMIPDSEGVLIISVISENGTNGGETEKTPFEHNVETLKSIFASVKGVSHYDVSYDESISTYLYSSAIPGSFDIANSAKNKNDSKEWDSFVESAYDFQKDIYERISEKNPSPHTIYYCLNDLDLKYILLIYVDGRLIYSAVDTPVTKSINKKEQPIIDERQALKEKLKTDYKLEWIGKLSDDTTGRWRLSKYNSDETPEKIALDYYTAYFENNDEIHAIINTKQNITVRLSILGNSIIDVTIKEYIEGEEQSAKTLFEGKVLKEYWVHIDTGKIEELEDE